MYKKAYLVFIFEICFIYRPSTNITGLEDTDDCSSNPV